MTRSLIVLAAIILASCTESLPPPSEFPQTTIIAIRSHWVVVNFDYLPLYTADSNATPPIWIARRGEVFRIRDQALERVLLYSENEHWYSLENSNVQGWGHGAGLAFYASEAEARTASQELRESHE